MKRVLKSILYSICPKWTTAIMSARARAHSHRVVKEWGCWELNQKLVARFGPTVQEGPFQGTVLGPMSHLEHLGPYLLGVYESELDPAWDVILAHTYTQIIDVGAKFGYYAVGLARRFPEAEVVAFDTDRWARQATREMADLNGAHHVRVEGYCDPAWLAAHLRPGALIISDCEGYEGELLASRTISNLPTATLVVEVHEELSPGVSARLREALKPTHDIKELASGAKRRQSTLELTTFSDQERSMANNEIRPPQNWYLCCPRRNRP